MWCSIEPLGEVLAGEGLARATKADDAAVCTERHAKALAICGSMDYEAVRLALGLADGAGSEWASIKSAGRQGVARAFQEGGVRKARLKLTKVVAAARVPGESVPSEKKRRRRANQRERAGLNRRGVLTDVQLFTLFATQ